MRNRVVAALGVGLAGGLLSGFFGVGGGIVMVPLILWVLRADQHQAHATSLAAIFLIAASGAAGYAAAGEVDPGTGLALGAGAVVGAIVGARTMNRMSVPALQLAFAVALIVAGIRMVV
ncbi:MAG: hypothetical protein KatS3mg011_1248 [Acidimicrobiia bacterium]|jgi:uncharacterized membrane protein YfcA|nr:MAG: hypothetical protein KatS3mg011_1248 [Acidimicrobiia bacterium]